MLKNDWNFLNFNEFKFYKPSYETISRTVLEEAREFYEESSDPKKVYTTHL